MTWCGGVSSSTAAVASRCRRSTPDSATPSLALYVLIADCVPVLLADYEKGVVAAVRRARGVRQGVVQPAVGHGEPGARAPRDRPPGACRVRCVLRGACRHAARRGPRGARCRCVHDERVPRVWPAGRHRGCSRKAVSPRSSRTRGARSRTAPCSPIGATALVGRRVWSGSAERASRTAKITAMSDLAENLRAVTRGSTPPRARPTAGSVGGVAAGRQQDVARRRGRDLAALGQRDFGENRAQELLGEAGELSDLALQWPSSAACSTTRPPRSPGSARSSTHSVDRESLVGVLDRTGQEVGRPVDVPAGRPRRRPGEWPLAAGRPRPRAGARQSLSRGPPGYGSRGSWPWRRGRGPGARVRAARPPRRAGAGRSPRRRRAVRPGMRRDLGQRRSQPVRQVVRVGTALFGDRPLASGSRPQGTESHRPTEVPDTTAGCRAPAAAARR